MKNCLYLFIVSAFLFVSCERNGVAPFPCKASAETDTVVFAGNQSTLIFGSCSTGLSVSVVSINDSRCPQGAVCVWQGTIVADLQVAGQFQIRLQQGIQKDTVYQGQKYSFTLTDVTPYPVSNMQPPADRKTFVRIIKQ